MPRGAALAGLGAGAGAAPGAVCRADVFGKVRRIRSMEGAMPRGTGVAITDGNRVPRATAPSVRSGTAACETRQCAGAYSGPGPRAGAPYHQLSLQHHAPGGPRRVLHALQQQFRRGAADVVGGLGDGGHVQRGQGGPVVVVEAGDADVLRRAQAGGLHGLQGAEQQQAVGGEQRVGALGGRRREALRRGALARFARGVEPQRPRREAVRRQGVRIARMALLAGGAVDAGEQGDAPPARLQQVFRGAARRGVVVQHHAVHARAFQRTVHEHERKRPVRGPQALQPLHGGRQDHAAGLLVGHQFQVRLLLGGVLVAVAEDEPQAVPVGHVFHGPAHVGEEGAADVRDDQADDRGTALAQPARCEVGPVAHFGDGSLHALAQRGAHGAGRGEHARYGGGGDAGALGDVLDAGQSGLLGKAVGITGQVPGMGRRYRARWMVTIP